MQGAAAQRRGLAALGVGAVLLLAFALRSAGFEHVFPGDDAVVFGQGDAPYHARRALWTLLNFPRALSFDPYINYPAGSYVPWPPGFDWVVAALAWLLGGGTATLERVAAWSAPVSGALAVLPIWALGRRVRSHALGLGAAAIFAALPLVVGFGRVGSFDHHPAQALVGATLLLLWVRALHPGTAGRPLVRVFAGLVAARVALALVWQGSFLYLGPGELALVGVAAFTRRRELLVAQAWSAAATALLLAPFLPDGHVIGGRFSAIELSWLHPLAYAICAAVAGGAAALEARRPAASGAAALGRAAGIAAALGLVALAWPGVREGLLPALDFLSRSDEYGLDNLENQPLFQAPALHTRALLQLGVYAYLVPLAPLALVLAARRATVRAPLLLLAGWAGVSGLLGLTQLRYLNDFAAVGSVGFALGLALLADAAAPRLPGPRWLASAGAAVLGTALLGPALPLHAIGLYQSLLGARGADELGPSRSLYAFARLVREATPATDRPWAPDARPEYSVLAHTGIGHILEYGAERPTPADNFGPYIGYENFRAVSAFAGIEDEAQAVGAMRALGARYVATLYTPVAPNSPAILQRLHQYDGSRGRGGPPLEHFRLITEGPRGGVSVAVNWGLQVPAGRVVPYKLFECVEAARLRVETAPGARVRARVRIQSNLGRHFTHEVRARAAADGVALLRLPYATDTEAPSRPLGPYEVSAGERRAELAVGEADVLEGRELRVVLP